MSFLSRLFSGSKGPPTSAGRGVAKSRVAAFNAPKPPKKPSVPLPVPKPKRSGAVTNSPRPKARPVKKSAPVAGRKTTTVVSEAVSKFLTNKRDI